MSYSRSPPYWPMTPRRGKLASDNPSTNNFADLTKAAADGYIMPTLEQLPFTKRSAFVEAVERLVPLAPAAACAWKVPVIDWPVAPTPSPGGALMADYNNEMATPSTDDK